MIELPFNVDILGSDIFLWIHGIVFERSYTDEELDDLQVEIDEQHSAPNSG